MGARSGSDLPTLRVTNVSEDTQVRLFFPFSSLSLVASLRGGPLCAEERGIVANDNRNTRNPTSATSLANSDASRVFTSVGTARPVPVKALRL